MQRLLESLANEDSTSILHENDLPLGSGNNSALVAVSQPSAIDDDDPGVWYMMHVYIYTV